MHLQSVWAASGDFCQQQWERIFRLCGSDPFKVSVFGTTVFSFLVFWLSNAFLLLLDVTGKPSALLCYKVQPDKNVSIVVGVPFAVVFHWVMQRRGCSVLPEELPTFHNCLMELVVCLLVEEVFLYYFHRLLHHPRLYKHLHKKHHEWTAPISVISIYAHPVDHVVVNLLPVALGPLSLGSHLAVTWLWLAAVLVATTVVHSGYHLPFLPSPQFHDYHHLKFNQNYGVLGVLDRLHGTDNQFRASKAYERHFLLLGFTPMAQQFPDQLSKNKSQ
ncbi:fatty acid hydroxylase domain-containing protein 2-like isoform X2 [Babylonia areolata]|uniref:fatty acid hydroxylase domain-containing protein 2-like isoform X2 n=1 Tax=Babylonia areolata TaxID=304850 RepID=UPI003FD56B88